MQNPQMAAMANMNAMPGPGDGAPNMPNGMRRPPMASVDAKDQLNTCIYEYFIKNQQHRLARTMIECDVKMNLNGSLKGSGQVNGIDGMEDSKDDLPLPKLPSNQLTENSFLLDWWVQYWDIWNAARGTPGKGTPYITHARTMAQMTIDQRNQRMNMTGGMGGTPYRGVVPNGMNGMNPNDLRQKAAINRNNPNGNMQNMNQMKNQAMMAAQMERGNSQMDMNGQRGQSPSSNENAPSPNKRPRVDGPMNPVSMPGNQFSEFAQQAQHAQQKNLEGMNAAMQGSPMGQQLDGGQEAFNANAQRNGMVGGGPPGPGGSNHALQDYQMQLMLLEQQNKKRLLMAKQEHDNISGPHGQGAVGGPGYPPNMSPQGSRAGPSPTPMDQMKKGTPRMATSVPPGSPMPDGTVQMQRNSPTPGMSSYETSMPIGVPPQYVFSQGLAQQPPNGIRAPSSHPGMPGQLTQQQMEAMQRNMPNGAWRGPPVPQGMMPGQHPMGPMGNIPQQPRNQMPPPPAPAGEQPRAQEPSPSQPAQAPPTPSTANKPNPKKKVTKDNKKPANNKKGAAGATPAATGGEEAPTPTPSTPITPLHPKTFSQNPPPAGPQQPTQAQTAPPQQRPPMDNGAGQPGPFGNLGDDSEFNIGLNFNDPNTLDTALENFDFDSFLHVGDDSGGFGDLSADYGFTDTVEASGEL